MTQYKFINQKTKKERIISCDRINLNNEVYSCIDDITHEIVFECDKKEWKYTIIF